MAVAGWAWSQTSPRVRAGGWPSARGTRGWGQVRVLGLGTRRKRVLGPSRGPSHRGNSAVSWGGQVGRGRLLGDTGFPGSSSWGPEASGSRKEGPGGAWGQPGPVEGYGHGVQQAQAEHAAPGWAPRPAPARATQLRPETRPWPWRPRRALEGEAARDAGARQRAAGSPASPRRERDRAVGQGPGRPASFLPRSGALRPQPPPSPGASGSLGPRTVPPEAGRQGPGGQSKGPRPWGPGGSGPAGLVQQAHDVLVQPSCATLRGSLSRWSVISVGKVVQQQLGRLELPALPAARNSGVSSCGARNLAKMSGSSESG